MCQAKPSILPHWIDALDKRLVAPDSVGSILDILARQVDRRAKAENNATIGAWWSRLHATLLTAKLDADAAYYEILPPDPRDT